MFQLCQQGEIPTGELLYHRPKLLGQGLALGTSRGNLLLLQGGGLILHVDKPFHKGQPCLLVKVRADVVHGLLIKVLDEPVVFVVHLQVDDDIRILFKVHRLHLEHFLPQGLQLGEGFGQLLYLALHTCGLSLQDFGHLIGGIQGN